VVGDIMPYVIHHLNGDPLDNRVQNLRYVDRVKEDRNMSSRKKVAYRDDVEYIGNRLASILDGLNLKSHARKLLAESKRYYRSKNSELSNTEMIASLVTRFGDILEETHVDEES